MLNAYSGSIKLFPSKDFKRLAFIVHIFAICMVYDSSFLWFVKILSIGCLLVCLGIVLCNQKLSISFEKLEFQGGIWHLYLKDKNAEIKIFQHMRVVMEVGIFFLLELSDGNKNNKNKMIQVVFFDQLSKEDYRMMRVLERI